MSVERNFISPQSNKPVMGIVQDSLSAAYYLTMRDTFLERHEVMTMLMNVKGWSGKMPAPCIVKPKPLWSGKQVQYISVLFNTKHSKVFSTVLGNLNLVRYSGFHKDEHNQTPNREYMDVPEILERLKVLNVPVESGDVNEEGKTINDREVLLQKLIDVEDKNTYLSPLDTRVLIRDGELLSGILCKKTLGTAAGSLIHVVALDNGSDAIFNFVDDVQYITTTFMFWYGMSIGLDDMIVPEGNEENVESILNQVLKFQHITHNLGKRRNNKIAYTGHDRNRVRNKSKQDSKRRPYKSL